MRTSRFRSAPSRSRAPSGSAGNRITASHVFSSTLAVNARGSLANVTLSCGGGGRSGPVRVTRTALARGKVSEYSKSAKVASGPETRVNAVELAPDFVPGPSWKPESSRSTVTIVKVGEME